MAIRAAFMMLILLLSSAWLCGQAPNWLWVNGAGGQFWDEGTCLACDNQGNVYVAGFFYESAAFGSTVLSSAGGRDLFVAKLDPAGNWLWARRSGGEEHTGIAVDSAGNAYLTGYFSVSADFGPFTLNSPGVDDYDIFVAKLDTDGNWLWAARAGGVNADRGMGIALDSSGKVYVTGFYGYNAVIGGTSLNCAGSWDGFVAKLDPDGNWLWAVGAGGLGYDWGDDLVLDAGGNIYLTGSFQMTADFGSHSLDCAGERDVLIAKLDPQGNWLWARRAGGWHYDHGTSIALGGGGLYCAGYFRESGDWGTEILASAGSYDLFVCKLNTDGNWLWARREGGVESDQAFGMDLDAEGNVWLAGRFQSSVDVGLSLLIAYGDYDVLIACIDPAGNWLRALGAGSDYTDDANDLVVCGSDLYTTGGYMDSVAFGPHSLVCEGDMDAWVAKINASVGNSDEVMVPGPSVGTLSAWPNPFTDTTLLKADSISIPTGFCEDASLLVFDLRGRKLRTITAAASAIRTGSIIWDGRDEVGRACPAGVYIVKLVSGGQTRARVKVALVR